MNAPVTGEIKDYLPFATALCGAFFGALGAYWVGRFKESRDEEQRRHTALIATQYALHSQWSVLEDIRKNFLDPVRKQPERYQKQKYYMRTLGHLPVDFDELTFIIDSDAPNLLQDIHIAEKQFLSSIELLDSVNTLRLEFQKKYHPTAFDKATGKGSIVVPSHEVHTLREMTDLLYDAVDKALPNIANMKVVIFDFVKGHFKGRKAIKFIPLEEEISKSTIRP